MLYTIQTFIEDYLHQRNFEISDNYAVQLAKLYVNYRLDIDDASFLGRMGKIRTVLFANNDLDRIRFEKRILKSLDRNYKKKLNNPNITEFPGGLTEEKEVIRKTEIKIDLVFELFKKAVEAKAIDSFWKSRIKGNLKPYPESIGQGLFGTFVTGVLGGQGEVIREAPSGIGFIDAKVFIRGVSYLVEIKILNDEFEGAAQLEEYMRIEGKDTGYLLIFDALAPNKKINIPPIINLTNGQIAVKIVNINPPVPHSLKTLTSR